LLLTSLPGSLVVLTGQRLSRKSKGDIRSKQRIFFYFTSITRLGAQKKALCRCGLSPSLHKRNTTATTHKDSVLFIKYFLKNQTLEDDDFYTGPQYLFASSARSASKY
jgi:hypothetical protein